MTRGKTQVERAPKELRPATRRWWKRVVDDYEFEAHHTRLLTLAGGAWDRATEATAAIKQDGAYVRDRYGCLKQHPALAVERDNRILFARLLRELQLDVEAPGSRPPTLSGYRRSS